MKEELQIALSDVIIKATNDYESAKGFILDEAPDIAQQVICWAIIDNLISMIIPLFIFLSMLWLCFKAKKHLQEKIDECDELIIVIYIVFCAFTFVMGIISLRCINITWLKAWITPKLYLIEYASELIKG